MNENPRKHVEEVVGESEHRWRMLTEALPQLVWSATPDGACDYFSKQWTEHTGVPESELLGWQWLQALHPDDREPTRKFWTNSVAGRGPYDVEYRVRRADGVYRWFKTRGVPIRDREGNIFKWFGSCTDFTDLRETEEALRLSEQRYRSLVEATAAIVWTLPPSGWADESEQPSWCSFTGQSQDRLPGWGWLEAVHPEDREETRERWLEAVAARSLYQIEYRVCRHDGEYRNMLTRGVPILGEDGELREWFGTCVDITDLKRAEEALRQAKNAAESLKDAAEAANRAKDEFLANVSHEIRTPMNAILGMTELALDTPLTEDQRQYLKTVKSAADSLLGIINDLLDFSKIEAGKLELDPADFGLRTVLGDTLRALAMRAHKKGLELVSHVQADVPDSLIGDAGRLRQVLLNLVGNAIKFTEEGEVEVSVEMVSGGVVSGEWSGPGSLEVAAGTTHDARLTTHLRFTVRDTGIGISQDKRETIFQAFEQEDTSTSRKYGGTGLGLTIASRLVALMGGKITVESEPGHGSIFAFTARFERQPHSPEPVATRPSPLLYNLPVLIVDDNATNRHILEEWLRGWQMEPLAVGDGVAAVNALWHRAASGRPYALVMLDARMPDTDGLTLAATIRERSELSATRLILLTSGDRPGDLARVRELRIDAHLLKPIPQDELLDTIYQVMSKKVSSGEVIGEWFGRTGDSLPLTTHDSPLTSALHILVAEDDEFSARLLEQLLARRGHRVRMASNGRTALALANEGAFDLLLSDVHMPELDGFQVVRAIRERERTEGGHLPCIALTARSRKEDRERCLAAGMDDCLTKPVSAAALFAAIDRVMSIHGGDPESGVRNQESGVSGHRFNAPLTPDPCPLTPGLNLLDAVAVLRACGNDSEGLHQMCKDFKIYLPARLAEVGDALRAGDAPRLRQAAHKICALLSAFSTVAGNAASDLEDLAMEGRLTEARPLVEQLNTMAQALLRQADNLSLETLRHRLLRE